MAHKQLEIGDPVQFKQGSTIQDEVSEWNLEPVFGHRGVIIEEHGDCPVYRGGSRLIGRTGWFQRRLVTVLFSDTSPDIDDGDLGWNTGYRPRVLRRCAEGIIAEEVPAFLFKRYKD